MTATQPLQPIPFGHFDRGRIFYPIVMNYVAQLAGFRELATQGLVGAPTVDDLIARVIRPYPGAKAPDDLIERLRPRLANLTGTMRLDTHNPGRWFAAETGLVAKEFVENVEYLAQPLHFSAAGNALILAHEVAKARAMRNSDPLWEFLRHTRNAAAHGGRFNFMSKGKLTKPPHPAKWHAFELTVDLHGTPLFDVSISGGDTGAKGMLKIADPMWLLWDIEQEYLDKLKLPTA